MNMYYGHLLTYTVFYMLLIVLCYISRHIQTALVNSELGPHC